MQKPTEHSQRRRARFRQRGNALLVSLIALTGLGTLGVITVLSVSGGFAASTADRSHAIALMAAESGAAAGLDFLRNLSFSQFNWFSNNIRASNIGAETPPAVRGNEKLPGQPGNVFSADMKAWYRVTIYNNDTDPNFTDDAGPNDSRDSDGRVTLRVEGFGPNRSTATILVEVQGLDGGGSIDPTPRNVPLPPPPQNLGGLAILSWREVE